jgi:hypothetical protein
MINEKELLEAYSAYQGYKLYKGQRERAERMFRHPGAEEVELRLSIAAGNDVVLTIGRDDLPDLTEYIDLYFSSNLNKIASYMRELGVEVEP